MIKTMGQGWIGPALVIGLAAALPPLAAAREPQRVAKTDAPVVIDGKVRQVFRNSQAGRTNYLVQIEVQRSEGRRPLQGANRPAMPAPGESAYVHVFQRQDGPQRLAGDGGGYSAMPAENSQIRAYLVPREQGGWEGSYPDWFDGTAERSTEGSPAGSSPTSPDTPKDRTTLTSLGLTAEPLKVQGRLALRVTSVERGSPAQRAGLEAGDVIVGAKGAPLTAAEQLDELTRRGAAFPLIVVDVNTGRTAQIEVQPTAAAAPDAPKPAGEGTPAPTPTAPSRSLGISAEPTTIGQRTALKVTHVQPGSPAAKAGVEPGDVLVAANGAAITGPEQLAAALRKSGPTLTLSVRDVRTGRETPVQVSIGGDQPADPVPPATAPAGAGTGSGKLGAVTELSFYDTEAAVKVTEVEPGSPADRAGLRPGTLILEANGKIMLHPNDLINAARTSTGTLKLTVVDPRIGRKGTLEVKLGG